MNKYHLLIFLFLFGLVVSAFQPHDYFTWFLEVFPAIIGFFVLIFTFSKFQFTYFTYCFILFHYYVLFIGGHYTYAEVPMFNWIKEIFHQSRNNYDKVGHFMQGFVPAIITREILIRKNIISNKGWLAFLTVSVCVTVSVIYEFLEWFVALGTGESADAFLGTQGYVWDTQSDTLFATIGAITMVLFVGKFHNNEIAKLK